MQTQKKPQSALPEPHQLLVILGPAGSGKSTLCSQIAFHASFKQTVFACGDCTLLIENWPLGALNRPLHNHRFEDTHENLGHHKQLLHHLVRLECWLQVHPTERATFIFDDLPHTHLLPPLKTFCLHLLEQGHSVVFSMHSSLTDTHALAPAFLGGLLNRVTVDGSPPRNEICVVSLHLPAVHFPLRLPAQDTADWTRIALPG